MENQTQANQPIQPNTKVVQDVKAPDPISAQRLLEALFFFWDGFERATFDFFLVKDTAHQVKSDTDLSGDKITLGVRKAEWLSGQGRIFREYMTHEGILPVKVTPGMLTFDFRGVPVFIYLYADNDCLSSFDIVFYRYETFNTPNPLKAFEEKYDHD